MQKFFDLLAEKFAAAIERGFTLACDRAEARRVEVDQDKSLELNGKGRKVVIK